jgi:hypothetical protein
MDRAVQVAAWVSGCMGQWVRGSVAAWVSGCVGQWVHESVAAWVSGCMGQWVHGSVAAWVSGCMGQWLHGSVGAWVSGCMGQWVHGSVAAWVSGCMGQWVHGSVGAWVSGCVGQWVPGSPTRETRDSSHGARLLTDQPLTQGDTRSCLPELPETCISLQEAQEDDPSHGARRSVCTESRAKPPPGPRSCRRAGGYRGRKGTERGLVFSDDLAGARPKGFEREGGGER